MRILSALFAVTCLLAGLLAAPPGAFAFQGDGEARGASVKAARSGDPVEVVERRTEHEQVFALPDGTHRYEATVQPRWTRRDGEWIDVDTNLQERSNRMIAPKATTVDLAFSGGGKDDPLIRIGVDGTTAELWWPKKLPTALVDGDTVIYPGVWKDVDLRLRATESGFTQSLVVKTAKAAKKKRLHAIELGARVTGGSLKLGRPGGLTLTDRSGKTVLAGPAPQMWDSAGAVRWPGDRLDAAGMGDRRSDVGLGMSSDGSTLTIRPDVGLLTGPDAVFPVYIDPPMNKLAKLGQWLYLDSRNEKKHNYWSSEGVGRCGIAGGFACTNADPYTARQYFEFSTEGWTGKQVIDARFRVFQAFSFACFATINQLKHVGEFDGGSNWGGIVDGDLLGEESTRHGSPADCDDKAHPSWVEFDSAQLAAKATEAAENAFGHLRLGLRAKDESDANTWKLFRNDAKLQIIYNTVPGKPTDPGGVNPPMRCVTGAGRPFIGSATPQLAATAPDADKQNLTAAFNIAEIGGDAVGTVSAGPKTAGSQFKATVTDGWLVHAGSYRWRARSHDGFANSPFTDWCEFTVDLRRPNAAPTVASADGTYPPSGMGGGPGVTGTFTLSANGVADPAFGNDVARYEWGLNNDRPDKGVAAPSLGADAEIKVTPTRGGPNTLYVRSVDQAGNRSDLTRHRFLVNPEVQPVAKDTFTRTVAGGWGSAEVGGPWSIAGNSANFAVDGQTGTITMPGAGRGPGAYLGDVASPSTDVSVKLSPQARTTGNGVFFSLIGRRVDGAGDYRAMLRLTTPGNAWLRLTRTDAAGQETTIVPEQLIDGLTYDGGSVLRLRMRLLSETGGTALKAKVWADGETEPAWQIAGEDATTDLQQPGGVGMRAYLSGTADDEPFTVTVDDLLATPPTGE